MYTFENRIVTCHGAHHAALKEIKDVTRNIGVQFELYISYVAFFKSDENFLSYMV